MYQCSLVKATPARELVLDSVLRECEREAWSDAQYGGGML